MDIKKAYSTLSHLTFMGSSVGFFSGAFSACHAPSSYYADTRLLDICMKMMIGTVVGFGLGVGKILLDTCLEILSAPRNPAITPNL